MPAIEIPDDIYRRVEAFTSVVRAVMNEDADVPTCTGMILERGLQSMLADIVGRQDQQILVESIQQLAARHPEMMYRYVADMIGLGADTRPKPGL